jgi:hypothetical protein
LAFGFIVERDRDAPAVLVLERDFVAVAGFNVMAAGDGRFTGVARDDRGGYIGMSGEACGAEGV